MSLSQSDLSRSGAGTGGSNPTTIAQYDKLVVNLLPAFWFDAANPVNNGTMPGGGNQLPSWYSRSSTVVFNSVMTNPIWVFDGQFSGVAFSGASYMTLGSNRISLRNSQFWLVITLGTEVTSASGNRAIINVQPDAADGGQIAFGAVSADISDETFTIAGQGVARATYLKQTISAGRHILYADKNGVIAVDGVNMEVSLHNGGWGNQTESMIGEMYYLARRPFEQGGQNLSDTVIHEMIAFTDSNNTLGSPLPLNPTQTNLVNNYFNLKWGL